MQLPPINGLNGWAAIDGAFQFLVVEEQPQVVYSASVKRTASIRPEAHKISVDPVTHGRNVIALKPHEPSPDDAAFIGGEGCTYGSAEDAMRAAEAHARQMRRGLA